MDVYRPAGNRGAVLRNNRLYMHRWHVTVCCHSYNERKRGPFWRVPLCKPPAHCLAMAVQNTMTPNILDGLVTVCTEGCRLSGKNPQRYHLRGFFFMLFLFLLLLFCGYRAGFHHTPCPVPLPARHTAFFLPVSYTAGQFVPYAVPP